MTSALFRFYWWLQRIIAPGLRYCQAEWEDLLFALIEPRTSWLDLGCGHNVLSPGRTEREDVLTGRPSLLVGLDYDLPSLRRHGTISNLVRADISNLPLSEASLDVVTSNMVFEHLAEPARQLEEIRRVLRPGGELAFITPNKAGYPTILGRLVPEFLKPPLIRFLHEREEHDVFPTFYRMNSPAEIERAVAASGLLLREIRLVPSSAQFAKIPPLAFFELIWIRITMAEAFKALRTTLIVRCVKPESAAGPPGTGLSDVIDDRG